MRPPCRRCFIVPQTGRTLPNLPSVSGAGPNGAETSQDRAARCAHQAGVYGQAAGDRNALYRQLHQSVGWAKRCLTHQALASWNIDAFRTGPAAKFRGSC